MIFTSVRPISRESSESILSLHFVAIVNIFIILRRHFAKIPQNRFPEAANFTIQAMQTI